MQARLAIFGLLIGLATPTSVAAHHYAIANFDGTKSIRLVGTLTRFEWTNPHARFHIDVKDKQGKVVSWDCETGGPADMARRGLRRDDLKIGDTLTVEGYRSRTGSPSLIVAGVKLPDGRRIMGNLAGPATLKEP